MIRGMRPTTVIALLVACGLLTGAAAAGAAEDTRVDANGNAFTGGLEFAPRDVGVPLGGVVVWTNRDFLVPHTATEEHNLWNLTGTWGQTPANPPGFAPGASVQRSFEAGTHAYYCVVHPVEMRGTVAVPVELGLERRVVRRKVERPRRRARGQRLVMRTVTATWAVQPPATDHVFDVEVRRGEAAWQVLETGTRDVGTRLKAGKVGTVTRVRARLRSAADPARATGWSPDASITSR